MEKLIWDTRFWGVDIYQVTSLDYDINKLKSSNPILIQALINVSHLKKINTLEENNFKFVESKITLYKDVVSNTRVRNDQNFRHIDTETLFYFRDSLNNMFINNTRYNIFSKEKINDFYFTWLLNSIKGEMDDACIGFFLKDNLAAFVTYKIKGNAISIGLLGVLPDFQGKGISQLLLNYIETLAIRDSLNVINISTQGKNLPALNSYIKSGFKVQSIDHWYYYRRGL